jgi:hypothetical protein
MPSHFRIPQAQCGGSEHLDPKETNSQQTMQRLNSPAQISSLGCASFTSSHRPKNGIIPAISHQLNNPKTSDDLE